MGYAAGRSPRLTVVQHCLILLSVDDGLATINRLSEMSRSRMSTALVSAKIEFKLGSLTRFVKLLSSNSAFLC